jgi:hypothetical protein
MILLPDPDPEKDPTPESSAAFDADAPDTMPSPAENETGPVFLLDKYRGAMIGITVTGLGERKPVYSLPKLAKMVEAFDNVSGKKGQARLLRMIVSVEGRYGPRAPVFVDDSPMEPPPPRPRIISPHNGNI